MRKTLLIVVLLLPAAGGCTSSYLTASDLAVRLDGRVLRGPDARQATIVGQNHEIQIKSGTGIVLVDGEVVCLGLPTRETSGEFEVSKEILKEIHPRTERPAPRPQPKLPPLQIRKRTYLFDRVVIDAGHGGHDLGASYGGVHEKLINLDIATKLADALRKSGMKVTLTRGDDTFIPLITRSEIANRAHPELMVSVHSNASPKPSARGIEVYYVAETFTDHGSPYDDNRRTSRLSESYSPPDDVTGFVGLPPGVNRQLLRVLLTEWRRESFEAAKSIEQSMVSRLGVSSRGVMQQAYSVLKWTCAPTVLVEVGFLSNPSERALLADPGYRTRAAEAIAHGILDYRERFEATQGFTK